MTTIAFSSQIDSLVQTDAHVYGSCLWFMFMPHVYVSCLCIMSTAKDTVKSPEPVDNI